MNKTFLTLLLTGSASTSALAQTPAEVAFGRIKNLAGDWTGVDEYGQLTTAHYNLHSAGHTVEEIEGGMSTMLTVDRDGVVATHYCSMGNQPRMRAVGSQIGVDDIGLTFVDLGNDDGSGNHIDSLAYHFVDGDAQIQTWTYRKEHVTGTPFSYALVRDGTRAIVPFKLLGQQAAVTRRSVGAGAFAAELKAALTEVASVLATNPTDLIGAPAVRYEAFGETIVFEAGYFYDGASITSGSVKTIMLPAGLALITSYLQTTDDATSVYAALHAWLSANNSQASGAPWEVLSQADEPTTGRVVVIYPYETH